MDVILNGISSSEFPLELKKELVCRVAANVEKEVETTIPQLLSIGLAWCLDEKQTMGNCGVILLNNLCKHPKLELLIPPYLAPELVKNARLKSVPILCVLTPVIVRTPVILLTDDNRETIIDTIAQYLAHCPIPFQYKFWTIGQKRDILRLVSLCYWAVNLDKKMTDKLLISVLTILLDEKGIDHNNDVSIDEPSQSNENKSEDDKTIVKEDEEDEFRSKNSNIKSIHPALGMLLRNLDPSSDVYETIASLLKQFPHTIAADQALLRCVVRMSVWPLNFEISLSKTTDNVDTTTKSSLRNDEFFGIDDVLNDYDMKILTSNDLSLFSHSNKIHPSSSSSTATLFSSVTDQLLVEYTSTWITAFLISLSSSNRRVLLLTAIPLASLNITKQLTTNVQTCHVGLKLLLLLLSSYQHSPVAFHLCLSELLHSCYQMLIRNVNISRQQFKNEKEEVIEAEDDNRDKNTNKKSGKVLKHSSSSSSSSSSSLVVKCAELFIELCEVQMLFHPGYPIEYNRVRKTIISLQTEFQILKLSSKTINELYVKSLKNENKFLLNNDALRMLRQSNNYDQLISSSWASSSSGSKVNGEHSVGLVNIGNTCFLNSVLQCFALNSDLRRMLLKPLQQNGKVTPLKRVRLSNSPNSKHHESTSSSTSSFLTKPAGLINELRKVMAILSPYSITHRTTYKPFQLHQCLPEPFNTTQQQDSAELIRLLFDCIENSGYKSSHLEDKKNDDERRKEKNDNEHILFSSIEAIFNGSLETRTRCLTCGHLSSRQETFSDLCLPLPVSDANTATGSANKLSLDSLLCRLLQPEDLVGDDAYECEFCLAKFLDSISSPPPPPPPSSSSSSSSSCSSSSCSDRTSINHKSNNNISSQWLEKGNDEDMALNFNTNKEAVMENETETVLHPHFNELRSQHDQLQRKQPACRQTVVVSPPQHLLISINRFNYDFKLNKRLKLSNHVQFNEYLHLPVENSSRNQALFDDDGENKLLEEVERKVEEVRYGLYAVIVHAGRSAQSGHYYAYAKNTDQRLNDDIHGDDDSVSSSSSSSSSFEWRIYNDESIRNIGGDLSTILGNNNDSDTPYIFFYKRLASQSISTDNNIDMKSSNQEQFKQQDSIIDSELISFLNKDNASLLKQKQKSKVYGQVPAYRAHGDTGGGGGTGGSEFGNGGDGFGFGGGNWGVC